ESLGALRAHIDLHPRLERNRVYGGPAADHADVVAGTRAIGDELVGPFIENSDRAAERVSRVTESEGAPGVAARAVEGRAIATRAERLIDDPPHSTAVDRDECIDLGPAFAEEV